MRHDRSLEPTPGTTTVLPKVVELDASPAMSTAPGRTLAQFALTASTAMLSVTSSPTAGA